MIVFGLDPVENEEDEELSFCPFEGLTQLFETDYEMLLSPVKTKRNIQKPASSQTFSIRIVNSFQTLFRKHVDYENDKWIQIGDASANDHTHNISEIEPQLEESFCLINTKNTVCKKTESTQNETAKNDLFQGRTDKYNTKQKSIKSQIKNKTFIHSDELFPNVGESRIQNDIGYKTKWRSRNNLKTTALKGRKRKRKSTRQRDQYKKRKDVLLKSTLRKCRKHYLEAYSNFRRIKFLECPKIEGLNNPDVFPSDLEHESYQQITLDFLEAFRNEQFSENRHFKDLAYFIGKN